MKKILLALFILSSACCLSQKSVTTDIYLLSPDGQTQEIGTVEITQTLEGLLFEVDLISLEQGEHGFHIHENGSCAPLYQSNGIILLTQLPLMSPACCTHFWRIVMNREDTGFPTESSSRWQSVDLTELMLIYFSQKANSPSKILQGIRSRASQVALVVKNPPANAGDLRNRGSIPGLERSPGGGPGNPLQYSGLENPMDGGAWRAAVHGVAESDTTEATQHA